MKEERAAGRNEIVMKDDNSFPFEVIDLQNSFTKKGNNNAVCAHFS